MIGAKRKFPSLKIEKVSKNDKHQLYFQPDTVSGFFIAIFVENRGLIFLPLRRSNIQLK